MIRWMLPGDHTHGRSAAAEFPLLTLTVTLVDVVAGVVIALVFAEVSA
jgi:hypothetical protein